MALAGCLGRFLRSPGPRRVASPYEVLGDEIMLGMIPMWHDSLVLSRKTRPDNEDQTGRNALRLSYKGKQRQPVRSLTRVQCAMRRQESTSRSAPGQRTCKPSPRPKELILRALSLHTGGQGEYFVQVQQLAMLVVALRRRVTAKWPALNDSKQVCGEAEAEGKRVRSVQAAADGTHQYGGRFRIEPHQ